MCVALQILPKTNDLPVLVSNAAFCISSAFYIVPYQSCITVAALNKLLKHTTQLSKPKKNHFTIILQCSDANLLIIAKMVNSIPALLHHTGILWSWWNTHQFCPLRVCIHYDFIRPHITLLYIFIMYCID